MRRMRVWMLALCAVGVASAAEGQRCCGDCDGNGAVAINELITAVNATLFGCAQGPRWVDNGDGTVTDNQTGLMWEKKNIKCPVGLHCYSTTFTWSTPSPGDPTGTVFTTFLYGLNGGTSADGTRSTAGCFTGHCDWRLPTSEELAGILDTTQGRCGGGSGPCIDPAFGPTTTGYYWSSTTYQRNSDQVWAMHFDPGSASALFKNNSTFVRAVRGGS